MNAKLLFPVDRANSTLPTSVVGAILTEFVDAFGLHHNVVFKTALLLARVTVGVSPPWVIHLYRWQYRRLADFR